MSNYPFDELDAALVDLFTDEPRIGVLGASRKLKVARATVQSRLDKMQERGILSEPLPRIDPQILGYRVSAFITVEIDQQARVSGGMPEHLASIPEVLEAHSVTGSGDLLVRIVAFSNADLQRVIDRLVAMPIIGRVSTSMVLTTLVENRTNHLARAFVEHKRASSSELEQLAHSHHGSLDSASNQGW